MKRIFLICMVLAVTSAADAKRSKKAKSPPEPEQVYEVEDVRLGEELNGVCLPSPMQCEPYDGRDNLLVVKTANESSALLQLAGGCSFDDMLFAQSIEPSSEDGCIKVGDALIVADSFGAKHECRITYINEWKSEVTYLEEYDEY